MVSEADDTLLIAVNPEGVAYSMRPAGLIARVLAYTVDSLIMGFAFGMILMIYLLVGQDFGTWIFMIIAFILQWFYYTLWEIFGNGATPGKRLVKIRVVSDDGSPVSPGASVTRNLLRFADTFMGLSIIGVICLLFSPGYRRLGDWAASTLVIHVDQVKKYPRIISPKNDTSVKLTTPVVHLSGEDKADIISFCRRYHRFGEERADEIAAGIVPELTSDPAALDRPGLYLLELGKVLIGTEVGG